MSKILVVGAHGTVGSSLVKALQRRGRQVLRATSRPVASADDVHLNLVTGEGLTAALRGADAAFLLAPPGHADQHALLGGFIDTAQAAGLGKLVLMSAMGADADPTSPLRRTELQLEASGLAWNVIRPNWFMQNFNTFWLHGIREQGRILLPTGAARGSFIDARDIAEVAAELLVGDLQAGQAFDLTGPEALNHDEVAVLLSREAGRDIRYTEISPEQMLAGLLAAGLPPDYAAFLNLILGYFKLGHAERITDAVATITGQAPRRFADYARDFRDAWR
ncbi:MAG: nucleoside-diphosphate sugar epimerase [Xanthomonadaceae bacterium]|nr:nucleoside-diphosphate sugar epimerase [Xanthomonadaceae bacterium]